MYKLRQDVYINIYQRKVGKSPGYHEKPWYPDITIGEMNPVYMAYHGTYHCGVKKSVTSAPKKPIKKFKTEFML